MHADMQQWRMHAGIFFSFFDNQANLVDDAAAATYVSDG
jgi:hypothetical protein